MSRMLGFPLDFFLLIVKSFTLRFLFFSMMMVSVFLKDFFIQINIALQGNLCVLVIIRIFIFSFVVLLILRLVSLLIFTFKLGIFMMPVDGFI